MLLFLENSCLVNLMWDEATMLSKSLIKSMYAEDRVKMAKQCGHPELVLSLKWS